MKKQGSLFLFLILILAGMLPALGQTTVYTYTGNLVESGNSANGSYDMQFSLYDALSGGTQVGSTISKAGVNVSAGVFSVPLDFGAASFPGAARFLEVAVRHAGGNTYTTLSPRSQITTAPYSIRALTVTGPVTGSDPMATLSVSNAIPGITNPSPINLPPAALRAEATSTSDSNTGLIGIADGTTGIGVIGISNGIAPVGGGANAAGVIGIASATSGKSFGVSGQVGSPDGIAVHADGSNSAKLFVGSNDQTGDVFTVTNLGTVFGRAFYNQDQSFGANQNGAFRAKSINIGPPAGNADTFVVQADGTVNSGSLFATGNLGATGTVSGLDMSLTGTATVFQLNSQGVSVTGPISATGNTQTGSLSVTNNSSFGGPITASGNIQAATLSVQGTSTFHDIVTNFNAQVHDLNIVTLQGGGSLSICMNGTAVAQCSSSLRYKTNVGSFNAGLGLVRQLRPISFDWKQSGMHDLGLGAEDVAKVEPLLVTYNKDGQVEGVKYDRIAVVLVNAVKEQQAQIEKQQAIITKEATLIEQLEQRLEKLENRRH